ncbi:MAG TPA: S8 family serine peptidase [Vitreimonas sp.]|nr:S8 family serine peptidase [Vitreimonas sp.]
MTAWREAVLARRRANRARFIWVRRHEQALRGEILAINPSPGAIVHARQLGFTRLRATGDPSYGVRIVVLAPPPEMSTEDALARLQADDPQGAYEFNHVYDPSQAHGEAAQTSAPIQMPQRNGAGVKIGMIDSGISTDHPALRDAVIQAQNFTGEAQQTPSPHGTAVASLLIGRDSQFHGIAPGAHLFAADVFGESVEGGSAEAIASALIWMAQQGVTVVNLSLTGPPNRGLEAVCRAMTARGMILVAAVGNDGPTAPVAYPAAIPGVVAVTAVDAAHRVLLTANRGPQIAFSSYGVSVTAAVDDGGYETMSGTSFAAPLVTAELALRCHTANAQQAVQGLSTTALDLGAPGRDDVYGYGFVI